MGLIRGFDKEFIYVWIIQSEVELYFASEWWENHPEELMHHVVRAGCGRMGLLFYKFPEIYWNCQYCIEFLDEKLRIPVLDNIYILIYVYFYPL